MVRCPYFRRQRKPKYIYCDLIRIHCANEKVRKHMLYKHCFNPEGYKICPFKGAIDELYDKGITD